MTTAINLKKVGFQWDGEVDSEKWVVNTLKTIRVEHTELREIIFCVKDSEDMSSIDPVEPLVTLDQTLVELRQQHKSIRVTIMIDKEGDGDVMLKLISDLLPNTYSENMVDITIHPGL